MVSVKIRCFRNDHVKMGYKQDAPLAQLINIAKVLDVALEDLVESYKDKVKINDIG